jgi:predicted metal-dependent hydrolase
MAREGSVTEEGGWALWLCGLGQRLVKKPRDLLEYVVVHEMVHLIAPTHSERFLALLGEHYPGWREARAELNELPLAATDWARWTATPPFADDPTEH